MDDSQKKVMFNRMKKKYSDVWLFTKYEKSIFYSSLVLISLIIISGSMIFSISNLSSQLEMFVLLITIFVAVITFLFQSFNKYKEYLRSKNALAMGLFVEFRKNSQLLNDLRKNWDNNKKIFLQRFSKNRTKISKKYPETNLPELEIVIKWTKFDKVSDDGNAIHEGLSKLDTLINGWFKKDIDKRNEFYSDIMEFMPKNLLTFHFSDEHLHQFITGLKYYTLREKRIKKDLSEIYWFFDIMKFDFELVTNGLEWRKWTPFWYHNAAIARIRYSKNTLQLIRSVLRNAILDDEIKFEYEDFKENHLNMLKTVFFDEI
ncbi:hypothetical protein ACFLTH_04390 [Bacteroidota bacterium]